MYTLQLHSWSFSQKKKKSLYSWLPGSLLVLTTFSYQLHIITSNKSLILIVVPIFLQVFNTLCYIVLQASEFQLLPWPLK